MFLHEWQVLAFVVSTLCWYPFILVPRYQQSKTPEAAGSGLTWWILSGPSSPTVAWLELHTWRSLSSAASLPWAFCIMMSRCSESRSTSWTPFGSQNGVDMYGDLYTSIYIDTYIHVDPSISHLSSSPRLGPFCLCLQ